MSGGTSNYAERAVVVGGGINALGVLRSLARAGVPVAVVAADASLPAMLSRYGRKSVCAGAGVDATGLVEHLETLADERGDQRAVLILTEEDVVTQVARHYDRLAARYRMSMPASDVLSPLLNKAGIEAVAEAADLYIPRTCRIQAEHQVPEIDVLQFPVVIKPAVRDAGYSRAFKKAYRIYEPEAARTLLKQTLAVLPDMIVQEWIEGSDSDLYFCLQYLSGTDAFVESFVGRKIRSWPPEVGGTASCVAAPEADEIADMTTRFFRQAGLWGLAGMEYKFDAKRGRYAIIEPTVGRTDFQQEVATLNGVNLPLVAYCDLAGYDKPAARHVRTARLWRERTADVQAAVASSAVRQPARSEARTVNALWRAYDPAPALKPLANRIRAKLGQSTRLFKKSV